MVSIENCVCMTPNDVDNFIMDVCDKLKSECIDFIIVPWPGAHTMRMVIVFRNQKNKCPITTNYDVDETNLDTVVENIKRVFIWQERSWRESQPMEVM